MYISENMESATESFSADNGDISRDKCLHIAQEVKNVIRQSIYYSGLNSNEAFRILSGTDISFWSTTLQAESRQRIMYQLFIRQYISELKGPSTLVDTTGPDSGYGEYGAHLRQQIIQDLKDTLNVEREIDEGIAEDLHNIMLDIDAGEATIADGQYVEDFPEVTTLQCHDIWHRTDGTLKMKMLDFAKVKVVELIEYTFREQLQSTLTPKALDSDDLSELAKPIVFTAIARIHFERASGPESPDYGGTYMPIDGATGAGASRQSTPDSQLYHISRQDTPEGHSPTPPLSPGNSSDYHGSTDSNSSDDHSVVNWIELRISQDNEGFDQLLNDSGLLQNTVLN